MEQTFGKYQLIKKLATGGMAEVWLAKQTGIEGFNRHVVIKRILPHLAEDQEFVQMFLNEAKIASRFNHPNIAQIYDLGETGGTYYIAMEFVHGEDLGRVMRKAWTTQQWVARPLAIRMIADACGGLYYAHTRTDEQGRALKVVHRDISPQNILVSFDGSVKLVDFGIAKAADSASSTKSGAIKGKFAYMAPEQAAGKVIDARADVFALGLVLYELITGERPLKRDSEIATLQAALECAIRPPSEVVEVPEDLDEVVMTALRKAPDQRYADARQFQMALEQYLVTQGTVAMSVQVSEMMEVLFQERLSEERRLGMPAPASESSVNNPALKSGGVVVEKKTQAGILPAQSPGSTLSEADEPEPLDESEEATSAEDPPPMEPPPEPVAPRKATVSKAAVPEAPRPSKVFRKPTKPSEPAPAEQDEPDDATLEGVELPQAPPRRPTGSIKRRTTTSGAMPEAPPRKSRANIPIPNAGSSKPARPDDADERKRKSSGLLKVLIAVVVMGGVVGGAFVFREPITAALRARNGGVGGGTPVLLSVTSNPRTRVTVLSPKDTKRADRELGDSPIDGVTGAFVGDKVVLVNSDQGIRYEEIIGEHGANELVIIDRSFREATLKVKTKPALKNATVWLNNRQVGKVGMAMKVFEGVQQFELHSDALSGPVSFEAKLEPGQTLEREVEVASALVKPQ